MPARDFSTYRNQWFATHVFKNEGATRFFGYVGPNGRTLGPKEVAALQDTFVHPQGLITRSAMLRDMANGVLKYNNIGVQTILRDSAASGTADTYTHAGAPGRLIGVWLDNYNNLSPAATLRLQVQTAPSSKEYVGNVTTQHDVITNATTITGTDSMDLTSNLFGLVGTTSANGNTWGFASGAVTVTPPSAFTLPSISVASPAVVTLTTQALPFANGDAAVFAFNPGVFSGGVSTGSTVYVGNILKSTNNVTFNLFPTAADALANTNAINCTTAATGTNTLTAPAAGTATATGVADSATSLGSAAGVPVSVSLTSQGFGYSAAPTLTWATAGTGTPTYGFSLQSGRIRSVDVFHPCDILPGGTIAATVTGAAGGTCRIIYGIALHSA